MTDLNDSTPFVAIIGAGFAGIIAGIHLKEKLNFHNFLIFEKGSDVGGVWRDNRYPGARCDVESHYYSLSTDLVDWEEKCASQGPIWSYIKQVIQNHHLEQHIRLNTEVVNAKWDGTRCYDVETRSPEASKVWKANVVISATGALHVPKMPNIKGLDTFTKKLFHSARWDESVDLKGKRVAVIGNGCSAAQIMSEIPHVEGIKVVQFGRTPSWIFPMDQGRMPNAVRWILRNIPGVRRLVRWSVFWENEGVFHLVFGRLSPQRFIRMWGRSLIKKAAPKKYHNVLIPDFPFGSRRIIVIDSHLRALGLPNVEYRSDAIKEITSNGILTRDGDELPFDVIICASGFVTDSYPIEICGRNSTTIQQYFEETGGPNAYYGITVPGFPNFAIVGGPNTATGYTTTLYFEETQMDYIDQLIAPLLTGSVKTFEVDTTISKDYNQVLQERLARSKHSGRSWYRANGTGRNVAIWPGSGLEYWRRVRSVNWKDYHVYDKEGNEVDLSSKHSQWFSVVICGGLFAWLASIFRATR